MSVLGQGPDDSDDKPLPRAARRPHRSQEETGLPPEEELLKLAKSYLTHVGELWPQLIKDNVVPTPTETSVAELAASFKERHISGIITPECLTRYADRGLKLAADYARYSADQSDPKSIWDQLRLALDRAKADGYFIPFELVSVDYARSATIGYRHGFQNTLKKIRSRELLFDQIYIDDFHRGSRNDADWWKLAGLCKTKKVRLLGVSDGFNLDGEDWDTKVGFYNLISRMDTKYKRQRVRRGMGGAAREERSLGRPPLGQTRRVKRNAAGDIERKPNGLPRMERCICPETSPHIERMFYMFVVEKLSPHRIMRIFNKERVDGFDGWTEHGIKAMLINPAYIGLLIWNRMRTEIDPETQKSKKVPNRWQDWEVRYVKELALIPKAWHVYARNKLVKQRKRRGARQQRCPASLFSGLLICGYCGRELKLFRSDGPNKQMACLEGMLSRRGCELNSCKSVRIIEDSLLRFVREHLLDAKALSALVVKCNEHLATLLSRPTTDVAPLRKQVAALQRELERLMDRVAKIDDDQVCHAYHAKISDNRRRLTELHLELAAKDRANSPPPPPLDPARVDAYVQDLRGLLNQGVPATADVLSTLIGPIKITHKRYEDGRRGAQWFAEFTPDLLRLLGMEAQRRRYPDADTLGFLSTGKWIHVAPVVVELKGLDFTDSRLTDEVHATMHKLLRQSPNMTNLQIGRLAGCGESTVARHRRRMGDIRQ